MGKPKRDFSKFEAGPKLSDKQAAFIEKRASLPEPPPLTKDIEIYIKAVLRRHGWVRSRLRNQALVAARVARGSYKCASCEELFKAGEVEVDHQKSVISPTGSNELADFLRRLFPPIELLAVLCKTCHRHCSAYDNARR